MNLLPSQQGMERESILLLVSTPLYAIVIGGEILLSNWQQRRFYSWQETLANFYLTGLNIGIDLATRTLTFLALSWCWTQRAVTPESGFLYWAGLILGVDFLYYWVHRLGHDIRLFWAVHVTHHSSTEFNLTTGFRSSVFEPLYRFVFYIPLALAGCRATDIFFAHSLVQIYGILVHTQSVGKLGWIEYILVTPSHHRVHHGSNVKYLDRNLGMFLILWDKLFGSFQAEDPKEPVVFGLTQNPKDRGPVNLLFHEWRSIIRDFHKPVSLGTRLKYLFKPPGWSHDGSTKTAEELRQMK